MTTSMEYVVVPFSGVTTVHVRRKGRSKNTRSNLFFETESMNPTPNRRLLSVVIAVASLAKRVPPGSILQPAFAAATDIVAACWSNSARRAERLIGTVAALPSPSVLLGG